MNYQKYIDEFRKKFTQEISPEYGKDFTPALTAVQAEFIEYFIIHSLASRDEEIGQKVFEKFQYFLAKYSEDRRIPPAELRIYLSDLIDLIKEG